MSLKKATDWLHMVSGGLVACRGFHHEGAGVYSKPDGAGWVRLRIDAAKSSVKNLYSCGVVIAIAHKEAVGHFSSALASANLLPKGPLSSATLCVNGHYLCPIKENSSYIYFPLDDDDGSRNFVIRLEEWIYEGVLPFVDKFSQPDIYWNKIEETKLRDWITADRLTTYGFQVSYSIQNERFDVANAMASSFVEECSDAKKHFGNLKPFALAFQEYAGRFKTPKMVDA